MRRLFASGADAVIATGTLPLGPAADATFATLLRFTEDGIHNSAEGEQKEGQVMRRVFIAASLLVLSTMQPRTAYAAVTEDMFQLRNTSDLVSLCSAGQTDPLYVAAIHFCHGFGSGAYGVASEYQAARSRARLFCPPSAEHRPSRNTATAEFVQWAGVRPDVMALPATDGLMRFIADRFPCSDAAVAKENRR